MNMQMEVSFPPEKSKLPEISWNYEELKKEVSDKLENYSASIVTDSSSCAGAKKDRATLSALEKAINDEKIRVKKIYNEPVALFESQVKEVLAIIENTKAPIDDEIKKYEEAELKKKHDQIEWYYDDKSATYKNGLDSFCRLEVIRNPKWDNTTYKLDDIKKEIDAAFDQTAKDLTSIEILKSPFETTLKQTYAKTRDIGWVLRQNAELTEIAEKEEKRKAEEAVRREALEKAEAERKTAAQAAPVQITTKNDETVDVKKSVLPESAEPVHEPIYSVILQISGSLEGLKELKKWLQSNDLTFTNYKGGNK